MTVPQPPEQSPAVARRFQVRGRVQGVGFRYFVVERGRSLDLRGYARNLPDGSVEVVAQGPEAALDRLRAELERGPALARVDRVDWSGVAPDPCLVQFRILH